MSDQPVSAPTTAPEVPTSEVDAQETQPDPAAATTKVKPKPPAFRKFKVGNEEVALTDDDIAKYYSKGKAADAKFREAAEARKSVENFMRQLQEDPEAVLSDKRLPLDRRKLAEKWLMEQIESELNPPDPREAKLTDAERRLKEYEERDRQAKEQQEQQERSALIEHRKQALSKTLTEAMQSTQLSAHPESAAAVLREMALFMRAARERGEDVTPDELVQHVHNSRFHQMYTLAHQFEGEGLIDFLGEEIVNRIRKADLARLRAGREPQATHKSESWTNGSSTKPGKKMDSWEAREHARKFLK